MYKFEYDYTEDRESYLELKKEENSIRFFFLSINMYKYDTKPTNR